MVALVSSIRRTMCMTSFRRAKKPKYDSTAHLESSSANSQTLSWRKFGCLNFRQTAYSRKITRHMCRNEEMMLRLVTMMHVVKSVRFFNIQMCRVAGVSPPPGLSIWHVCDERRKKWLQLLFFHVFIFAHKLVRGKTRSQWGSVVIFLFGFWAVVVERYSNPRVTVTM